MEAKIDTDILEKSALVERVARIVSSVRGVKPDYTSLAVELEQAIPFDIFGIGLLRYDRQAVRVTVCQRERGAWRASHHQHPLTGSMLEQILSAPNLIVRDHPNGLEGSPACCGDALLVGSQHLRSTLIAPLMVEDRVLGTLELESTVVHTYDDTTLQRFVNAVARVLATAIESAQLGGTVAIQDRQRQVLKDVTRALNAKMDLSAIFNQIVVGIANTLDVASMIIMHDGREGRLSLAAQSGLDAAAVSRVLGRPSSVRETCIIGRTLLRRQPHVSHDIAVDTNFPDSRIFATELGVHSIFCYPLVTETTVFGALLLCSPEPGGFTPLKTDILSLFASQVTVAIHNGIQLEAAQRRSRFQKTIEQFEQIYVQNLSGAQTIDEASVAGNVDEQALRGQCLKELEMFARVREETQRTFGVSFSSLLHFVSAHLLTTEEQDLQAMIAADRSGSAPEVDNEASDGLPPVLASQVQLVPEHKKPLEEQKEMLADTLLMLTRNVEEALIRTGIVGEWGRFIMQFKQTAYDVKDAWFVVDLNGICQYMNPAAALLCGKPLKTGSYASQLFGTTQQADLSEPIESIFANLLPGVRNADEIRRYLHDVVQGSAQRQEVRCVLAAEPIQEQLPEVSAMNRARLKRSEDVSSDYHYQFKHYPLYDPKGVLIANILHIRDVTEQVRDEKNRSALLSSVSHDLRTPLTTIKAAVTGLLQSDVAWEEHDWRAMLEDIEAETDHLTVLVNALVDLSRIEMGALSLEKEWCDVVEVVHGTLAKMKRVLANHSLRMEFQAALPLVLADHVQLERVFYNLLENAVHHSPAHTEIVIKLECIDTLLHAQVIDHGQEIPEREREHIFKSFYSLRSYGDGLGLAICRGIIEAHQGRIWVEGVSDVQEATKAIGSCLRFTLPVHPYSVVPEKTSFVDRRESDNDASVLQKAHEAGEEL